jgi:hypothetical protein
MGLYERLRPLGRFDPQSRRLPLLEKVAVGAVGAVGAYQCDQCDQQFWRDTLSEKSSGTLVPLVPLVLPVTAGTAGTAGSRVSPGDTPTVWLIAPDLGRTFQWPSGVAWREALDLAA